MKTLSVNIYKSLFDIIWISISAIAAYLFLFNVQPIVSSDFFRFLYLGIFLAFIYFGYTIFLFDSKLAQNIWVKVLWFTANIFLFFVLLKQYYTFAKVTDDYNYTLASGQVIKPYTELDMQLYIKKMIILAGIIPLFLMIVFQIRLFISFFQTRQLDKVADVFRKV
ncbi:MAG TPA: hypothetical protein PKO18_09070 [Chitinophagales bacterium]|nr:hypothetical protein [Chitinophagales bacterium]HNL85376.1 hypothetical protein [Chitinophagales bacterium]